MNKGLPKSPGGSQEYWAHLKVIHQSSARNAIQLLYHVKEKIIIIWASITSSGPRSRRRWPCQLRRRHLPWRSRRFHSPVRLDDKFRTSSFGPCSYTQRHQERKLNQQTVMLCTCRALCRSPGTGSSCCAPSCRLPMSGFCLEKSLSMSLTKVCKR